jgi:hypothetical protein
VRILRREVELPLRRYERAGFYLGLASLLLCLFILLDAALWARSATISVERARLERAHAADARLRPRRPCVAAAADPVRVQFQDQARKQLEHTRAVVDPPDVARGRHGSVSAPGR